MDGFIRCPCWPGALNQEALHSRTADGLSSLGSLKRLRADALAASHPNIISISDVVSTTIADALAGACGVF
jgi:hypothetical protein